ncbi:MAG: hypothetical protein JW741_11655 [Sedimentisphaerales bacterium]|nr:hypothetical protein [Sedimentisphaerales bacterium]
MDTTKRLLEAGTAEELDKVFVPVEYCQGPPTRTEAPDPAKYAWQAEILKKRLQDGDPAVRAIALRVLSALDYKAALGWAKAHLGDSRGELLLSCIHALLGVHNWTRIPGGEFAGRRYLVQDVDDDAIRALMLVLEKQDTPLANISSHGLRVLIKELHPSAALSDRIRAAIRQRTLRVQETGERGEMERSAAVALLDPLQRADWEALVKITDPGQSVYLRACALRRMGEARGELVSEIGRKYLGDPSGEVRSAAFGLVTWEEQYHWYLGYLGANGRQGARIVVEHLGRAGELQDILKKPGAYRFISEFTPEQVSWLEEAGLNKAHAQTWKKVLEDNKGASAPESKVPPTTPPMTSPAKEGTGPAKPAAGRTRETSDKSLPSWLGTGVVVLLALAITWVVALVIVRARRTKLSSISSPSVSSGLGAPETTRGATAGKQPGSSRDELPPEANQK